MKKTTIIIIAFAVVTAILGICLTVSASRSAEVEQNCTAAVFGAVRELARETDTICETREYGQQSRETIAIALERISRAVSIMNYYDQDWKSFGGSLHGLTQVLGMWNLQINNAHVESIPYDGIISDEEAAFLSVLHADLEALLIPMLAEDGLNMRRNLSYRDIRGQLEKFCQKYSTWDPAYEPYDILN